MNRRDFLERSVSIAAGLAVAPLNAEPPETRPLFKISLAQWSLHRALFAGELDPLDFPALARDRFDLGAVEYVNAFFIDKARDERFLDELARRAEAANVRSLLIMVDREGDLGDPDDAARAAAIEAHHKWVAAAKHLGCHSIRVNARSSGPPDTQRDLAADGLRRLCEYAAGHGINVIVENHGGLSSNGEWLASVIGQVNLPNCGTLPDFGNFQIEAGVWYDRYRGVEELMPFAKAVSAKSHDFDARGNEVHTDYRRMMRIVLDAGYRGHVGIEYEGQGLPEMEGIAATKRLLEVVREEFS